MGWTYTHREKGVTHKDFFSKEFSMPVLEASQVGNYVYLAVQGKHGLVFAVVCDTVRARDSYLNFGYKDLNEFEGPHAYDCPRHILERLSPLESFGLSREQISRARYWRDRCWERARLPRLKKGKYYRVKSQNPELDGKVVLMLDPERLVVATVDGSHWRVKRTSLAEVVKGWD